MNRAGRAPLQRELDLIWAARADAKLRRELDLIWADFAARRSTRRGAETAHDRALAAAGLPLGFAGEPSCDPRAD